jgi:hypothetical protein
MQPTDALPLYDGFTAYMHLTNLAIDFRIILTLLKIGEADLTSIQLSEPGAEMSVLSTC